MIVIFDLDDTLYPERSYVTSGFKAVASMLENSYGWNRKDTLSYMVAVLEECGRGAVFDKLLKSRHYFSKRLVQYCLQIYRQHDPLISLATGAEDLLKALHDRPVYMVTDGNKNVQAKKIHALQIDPYFKKIFITHRYGIKNSKPSLYCFDLIRKRERCDWSDMIYIGDNPRKDFVNLNSLGVLTVRVLTGEYSRFAAEKGYDAKIHIQSIGDLKSILDKVSI